MNKELGKGSIKISYIIEKLKEQGFYATRTQFDNLGIKTDANKDELLRIMSN